MVGTNEHTPNCTWIDGDHSDGRQDNQIPYQGFGLHLIDFDGSDGRALQYKQHPETLCDSKPRFHMYEEMNATTWIPIFHPNLEYYDTNHTDKDFSKLHTDGIIPPNPDEDKDNTPPFIPTIERKRSLRRHRRAIGEGELVVSHHVAHSARSLCTSLTSVGPDFVSVEEGVYCDMTHRSTFPICPHTEGLESCCFNYNSTEFEGNCTIHSKRALKKRYTTVRLWEPGMKTRVIKRSIS